MTPLRTGAPHRRRAGVGIRARAAAPVALAASLVAVAVGLGGLSAQSAFADTTDDGNLVVDVTDGVKPRPTPTPKPPFAPPGPPPWSNGNGNGNGDGRQVAGEDTQATIPDPVAADGALGDETVVSGPLAMSGLTATASPSLGIGNGTLTLSFVVRNTYDEPVDATAHFWVNDVAGNGIAEIDDVEVEDLEPDETRRVLVEIAGLGQHSVLRAYVTLVPPSAIGGDPVAPITRNTVAFVPPLFSMSLAGAIGALSGLAWWTTSPRGLGLRLRRLRV